MTINSQAKNTKSALSGLRRPFERGDLALISQAANGAWPVDAETQEFLIAGVMEVRDSPDSSKRTQRSAIRTLATMESVGWRNV